MDLKDKIPNQDKVILRNILTEAQVLETLLNERKVMLGEQTSKILLAHGFSPKKYTLHVKPSENVWEVKFKRETLITPDQIAEEAMKGRGRN